ncbi:MAG: hypothetical protein CMB80_01135 [Flammeovirgaceae bacterium]|nr:hypothetical protein [Flammeovirgaceae bacterium]|tara:strand:- start:858 stop:1148 length:291 start_codon:yes stop_codon:yes gene_type:complete
MDEREAEAVFKGIHVYRKTSAASSYSFAVPVYGEREDFVAADLDEVVFMKIRVDFKELEKALQKSIQYVKQYKEFSNIEYDKILKVLLRKYCSIKG